MKKYIKLTIIVIFAFMMMIVSNCFAAKKVVAVPAVENSVGTYYGNAAAQDFESQLVTALVQSGRYDVVERGQMDYVIRELGLQSTGLISGDTAIQFGQLVGADYTVIGNVTAADVQSFNNYLYSGTKGKVKFNFKFIDNRTGVVKISEIIEGSDTVSEFENNVPDERILISGAVNDASKKIVSLINDVNPITGVVAAVSNNEVYIDLGLENGAHVNDRFVVYREGEVITHPVTGEIIGVQENVVGLIKVKNAKANYSVCDIMKTKGYIRKGDKIKKGNLK